MAGVSSQTPTIIIRLTSLSMRSHAVSTRDMRRSAAAVIGLLLGRLLSFGNDVGHGRPSSCAARCWVTSAVTTDFHAQETHAASCPISKPPSKAVADSKQLPEKPDNMTLLKIYALYKQASEGDVDGKRPGFTDMVGRAKWDAWNGLKGKRATHRGWAMQEYVDLIESLK
jgi:diazepam-binding inhibitor (GABA receptor modulating acyl-CoA-binding protein)